MEVALVGWWPASEVDDVGAWKGDEQPTNERLRKRESHGFSRGECQFSETILLCGILMAELLGC
jgi:hypothetical protein